MSELKTPEQWSKQHEVVIIDPDGWREANAPALNEPITEDDFLRRMSVSTARGLNGLEKVRLAIEKDRGGPAPVTVQGWA